MKVIEDICSVTIGVEASVSRRVKGAHKVIADVIFKR